MAQAAASTCEICTAGPGEHYCQQCDQLFCGSCKLSHLRTKISKNHTFLSGPSINKEEKHFCTEHEEMFLFYCDDCDTPVCRICSVEKHSRHLMTDLTKSVEKLRFEVVKNIEAKVTTSKVNLSKIEKETKTYRDEVKAVIKTITEEGNYWKNLIDKKVGSFVRLLHDEEQKTIQNITALTKVYRRDIENCQQWEKKIKEMETMADVLLFERLKKLKVDVDNIDLKPVPEGSYVSYRNKKPSGTEIDRLFGEMEFKEGKAIMENAESQQKSRPKKSKKRYKYTCQLCRNEQVLTNEPATQHNGFGFLQNEQISTVSNFKHSNIQRQHQHQNVEDKIFRFYRNEPETRKHGPRFSIKLKRERICCVCCCVCCCSFVLPVG